MKCPHCGEPLKKLNFSADMEALGSCDLEGNNLKINRSRTMTEGRGINEDSLVYLCPKCDEELDLDDLEAGPK